MGAAWSWYLLRQDAPLKEPDQYYGQFDRYGAAARVFVWFTLVVTPLVAGYWVVSWMRSGMVERHREVLRRQAARELTFDPDQPPPTRGVADTPDNGKG